MKARQICAVLGVAIAVGTVTFIGSPIDSVPARKRSQYADT